MYCDRVQPLKASDWCTTAPKPRDSAYVGLLLLSAVSTPKSIGDHTHTKARAVIPYTHTEMYNTLTSLLNQTRLSINCLLSQRVLSLIRRSPNYNTAIICLVHYDQLQNMSVSCQLVSHLQPLAVTVGLCGPHRKQDPLLPPAGHSLYYYFNERENQKIWLIIDCKLLYSVQAFWSRQESQETGATLQWFSI